MIWCRQIASCRGLVGNLIKGSEKVRELIIFNDIDALNKEANDGKDRVVFCAREPMNHMKLSSIAIAIKCVLRVYMNMELKELKGSVNSWDFHGRRLANVGSRLISLFANIMNGVVKVGVCAGTRLQWRRKKVMRGDKAKQQQCAHID